MFGVVPLRAVYTLTDPPCLEWDYVSGYDAAGLIRDWRWRLDKPRPGQAVGLVRRAARIVGQLHRLDPPLVHRGLKPTNLLLKPTPDGKVTAWVADVGWGLVAGAAGGTDGLFGRRAAQGTHGLLYMSPQQKAGDPPDPRDDVYALGMVWYQLLMRDPAAPPPADGSWAAALRPSGLGDGAARLLASCLDPNPARRPADGAALADLIAANAMSAPGEESRTFRLQSSGGTPALGAAALPPPAPARPRLFALADEADAAALDAALPARLVNEAGMEMVLAAVAGRPVYLSAGPLTRELVRRVTGAEPAGTGLTRAEAEAFCRSLGRLPDEAAARRTYRLPTDAELEAARRAGVLPRGGGQRVAMTVPGGLVIGEQ